MKKIVPIDFDSGLLRNFTALEHMLYSLNRFILKLSLAYGTFNNPSLNERLSSHLEYLRCGHNYLQPTVKKQKKHFLRLLTGIELPLIA